MIPSLWLARRELSARRWRAALAAMVVAAATGLVTATEVLARAREDAIAAHVDALGPPIRILPRGASPGAIPRHQPGGPPLPADAEPRLRAALGRELRVLESRRVAIADVEGAPAPVVAASSGATRTEPGTVVLGSAAGARLAGRAQIAVGGESLRVAAILPATATSDDIAVYVSADAVERLGAAGGPSELRVFLAAGADVRSTARRLAAVLGDLQVLRSDRGEVADGAMEGALARHRLAAYLVTGSIAALCLLIAVHLDAAERRVELATLAAIGATRPTLAGALVARSVLVAAVGGVAGISAGVAIASALDPTAGAALVRAAGTFASVIGGASAMGALAALPAALAAAARDPVPDLQDG